MDGGLLYLTVVLGLALGFGARMPLLGWIGRVRRRLAALLVPAVLV